MLSKTDTVVLTSSNPDARHGERVAARASLAAAFALGASLLFLVGFAQSAVLHDVAHDTRHTMAFPCH